MQEISYVYILATGFKHLYIGATTEIEHRTLQHKNKAHPSSFTARYNMKDLVYFGALRRSPICHHPRKATKALVSHQENPSHRSQQPDLARSKQRLG
jgi:predicted GIY-YIG superfamily endonuclease